MHAVGRAGTIYVTYHGLNDFLENAYVIRIPVLNPGAVIPEEGTAAYNCFTAVLSGIFRGRTTY